MGTNHSPVSPQNVGVAGRVPSACAHAALAPLSTDKTDTTITADHLITHSPSCYGRRVLRLLTTMTLPP